MKALEFEATLDKDGVLKIPADVAARMPLGAPVRVLLLVQEPADDEADERAWKRFGAEQFLKGYAPEDAIYDRYDELSGR
jgi:hypothetical protein